MISFQIFDSIIRLAIVNNKLCSAGCVLFKDWTARFLCDRKKPVCSILEFGLAEGSPTMKVKKEHKQFLLMATNLFQAVLWNWQPVISS